MFEVNEYFEGKVKSIAFDTDTLPATIGVMYCFFIWFANPFVVHQILESLFTVKEHSSK